VGSPDNAQVPRERVHIYSAPTTSSTSRSLSRVSFVSPQTPLANAINNTHRQPSPFSLALRASSAFFSIVAGAFSCESEHLLAGGAWPQSAKGAWVCGLLAFLINHQPRGEPAGKLISTHGDNLLLLLAAPPPPVPLEALLCGGVEFVRI
jgi:hypothetical protein